MTTTEYAESQETDPDSASIFDTDTTEEKPKRRQTATWKRLLDDPFTRGVVAGQLGIREEALTSGGAELSAAEHAANTALADLLGAVGTALRES